MTVNVSTRLSMCDLSFCKRQRRFEKHKLLCMRCTACKVSKCREFKNAEIREDIRNINRNVRQNLIRHFNCALIKLHQQIGDCEVIEL